MNNTERKPVLVISVPKAGTYLLSEVLKNLGLEASDLHINVNEYQNYQGATINDALLHPENYTVASPLSRTLNLLEKKQFAVSHLPARNKILSKGQCSKRQILSNFRTILLIRDLRKCLVSHMNFDYFLRCSSKPDRSSDKKFIFKQYLQANEERLFYLYANLIPWLQESEIQVLKYEDLASNEVDELLDFSKSAVSSAIKHSLSTKTLTRSKLNNSHDIYWDEDSLKLYERRIKSLNQILGYDQTKQSNIKFTSIKILLTLRAMLDKMY